MKFLFILGIHFTLYIFLRNIVLSTLWSFIGRESITWCDTNNCYITVTNCEVLFVENKINHVMWYKDACSVLFTGGMHYLDRSHRWSISSALYETAAGSRKSEELFLWTDCLLIKLSKGLLRCTNVWRRQQNFEKRDNYRC